MLSLTLGPVSFSVGAPLPPTFATDFYVGEQANLAIVQGGYSLSNGEGCCSATDSAACKVQTVASGSDVREQGSKNRTRSDGAQGAIVTWYAPINKQMAIQPGSAVGSSHKWACAQYCPQDGEFFSELAVGNTGKLGKPQYRGTANFSQPGVPSSVPTETDHWFWEDGLFTIPFEEDNLFVTSGANPAPWYKSLLLEPFGQKLGTENASFLQYTPGVVTDDDFDIDPATIASCPKSDNCNDDNKISATLARHNLLRKPMLTIAKEKATAMPALVKDDPVVTPNITFADDYVAEEDSILVQFQGGEQIANGDYCCPTSSPQCQIQLSHFKGMRYYDKTNQRTRIEDHVANQVQVDDFNTHMSMLINITNGVETCQEYCPLDPQEYLGGFSPFDPFDTVTDLGKTTFEGKSVEHYQWADKVFKVITMSTTDFYAELKPPASGAGNPVATPIFMTQALTPFGEAQIGTSNETFISWSPGTPDPAKFNIAGVGQCPQSGNCGNSARQLRRLMQRQYSSFYRYSLA